MGHGVNIKPETQEEKDFFWRIANGKEGEIREIYYIGVCQWSYQTETYFLWFEYDGGYNRFMKNLMLYRNWCGKETA